MLSSTDRREIEGPGANTTANIHLVAATILGTRHPPGRAAPTSSSPPGINLALVGLLEDSSLVLPSRFGHQLMSSADVDADDAVALMDSTDSMHLTVSCSRRYDISSL